MVIIMILADKIIRHRKKNGWSQEELAEKMNVSRQAVSKWESAQAVPDIDKILMLGKLFGVTTDYLLKEEIEDEEIRETSESPLRVLTVAEVREYLSFRKAASVRIAAATFICILSPLPLIILGAVSEKGVLGISENFAGAVGLISMLIFAALACVMFVQCGMRNEQWEFLKESEFKLGNSSRSIAEDNKKALRPMHNRFNIIGTVICILSPIPLFIGAFTENELFCVIMLCCTMVIAGIGVVLFITAGVQWSAVQLLLEEQECDSDDEENKKSSLKSAVSTSYWLIITAIYLLYSFIYNDWHMSWIIWPVAGVLFGVVMNICNIICISKDENQK